ncbi:MAG: phosphoribosylformylglycinamidine synthase, partial [Oscillospiraceae bacterium]
MVYRVYVEKKQQFADEAATLLSDIRSLLMIENVEQLRLFNRYDVENIDEELFKSCENTVFSEPQLDNTYNHLPQADCEMFAVEYLPGQFDQRADSCAQCIQIVSQGDKPTVKTAKVYMIFGKVSKSEIDAIKKYVINPVESREAVLDRVDTLNIPYEIPTEVQTLDGFINLSKKQLAEFVEEYSLAMDSADIEFCQDYFKSEKRNPFLTPIDGVELEDETVKKAYERDVGIRKELSRTKPQNLMDLATIGARYLKHIGELKNLDESEEINACTVKMAVPFKNETHNHPTEIEPFGGAATCLGGAIRDPLSGRSYVYQAMRVTGSADPYDKNTLKGKLPQKKIITGAASGYSSYGNQIGLATGMVNELYHDGYRAKRMEIGAVIAAAPAKNVVREVPNAGDIIVLLGGKTGRDGCGGATGSSKSHNLDSLENCGAEVQKGNAPEERKIQRLMRNENATVLIKRCNDFGAGGVSVAIGELADGLDINLDVLPKKYDGLDGTELAISESQERMACVIAPQNVDKFMELAKSENLEATIVAKVTDTNRLVLSWKGNKIVNISRDFLNSNGAVKHTDIKIEKANLNTVHNKTLSAQAVVNHLSDLNICSQKGLAERFDATVGGGTVLMPFGGEYQLTPNQAMAAKIPVRYGQTDTTSLMAWGFNPYITSPYHSAIYAVIESVYKIVATGGSYKKCWLTFQEYFEKTQNNPSRWGKPMAALLGAYNAQMGLSIASIGGKDSMSGTFEDIDVPPTLVSFAVSVTSAKKVVSPEFKQSSKKVYMILPEYNADGLPNYESVKNVFDKVEDLINKDVVNACATLTYGGLSEVICKMSMGNKIGVKLTSDIDNKLLFNPVYGGFILELDDDKYADGLTLIGVTTCKYAIIFNNAVGVDMNEVQRAYESKLEPIYPYRIKHTSNYDKKISYDKPVAKISPAIKVAKPKVLIPVFPGTNCEYDCARAFERAGADTNMFVVKNLTSQMIKDSAQAMAEEIRKSQIIMLPGGFSGGDEPDGSAKFIVSFFKNPIVKEAVTELLQSRDGLMLGICNGFQALIKLGLVPYGEIRDMDENAPTLTYNTIGRHQSMM